MSNTLERLCALGERELGSGALADKAGVPFTELGLDSLGLVDFIFTVEDSFQVRIDHDRVLQTPTLAGLAVLVDELLADGASAQPVAA